MVKRRHFFDSAAVGWRQPSDTDTAARYDGLFIDPDTDEISDFGITGVNETKIKDARVNRLDTRILILMIHPSCRSAEPKCRVVAEFIIQFAYDCISMYIHTYACVYICIHSHLPTYIHLCI